MFVELRKKLDKQTFKQFSQTLITLSADSELAGGQKASPGAVPTSKLNIDTTVAELYSCYLNDLSLNQIKVKLRDTYETWIVAILFVLNLSAFAAKSGVTFEEALIIASAARLH